MSAKGTAYRLLPVLVACVAVTICLGTIVLRIGYAYELEWMEGGMLDHVTRVRSGEALYGPPSLEFGAFPYTPLFVWASTLAAIVFGEGFLGLRLVSVAATVAILALLIAGGRRASGSWQAGVLSSGLFAAGYAFTGAWFDIGRVDALSIALGLAALHLARFGAGSPAVLVAAALAVLSCLAKQSGLLLAVALAPLFTRLGWRAAALYTGTFCVLLAAAVLALQAATDGWFRFWTWDMLRRAPVHGPAVLGYWRECAAALGAAAAIVFVAVLVGARAGLERGVWIAAIALIATGWIGRAHEGGFENNLIPALLAVSLLFGPAAAGLVRQRASGITALAVSLAFGPLIYDPRPFVPTDADRAGGDRVVETLRGLEPPLFLPDHGYLRRRAFEGETRAGVHGMVINDLLKSGLDAEAARFTVELESALREQRFGAVILDEPWSDLGALREFYSGPVALWETGDTSFEPVTGAPKRPSWIYFRR